MVKFLSALSAVCLSAGLGLAASVTSSSTDDFKIAGVLPGSINDRGFVQFVYEGLVEGAKRTGGEMAYSENVKQSDQQEAMRDYARRGYSIIIGAGGEFVDASKSAAKEFPETKFVVLNSPKIEGVSTIAFNNDHFGYTLGYITGKTSKSGSAGLVAGQEISAFLEFSGGFRKGMESARPDGKVLISYTNDWDDVAKAKSAAQNQIAQGADVLLGYLDKGAVGVFQAAEEQKVWAVSYLFDLGKQKPDLNLASVILDYTEAVALSIELAKKGELKSDAYLYTLGSPAGHLGTINPIVSDETKKSVDEFVREMSAGTFKD